MKDAGKGTGAFLVETEDLAKYFPISTGVFGKLTGHTKAVDGLSLYISRGETLGLVGESGCGKTTVGRLLLRLIEPTRGKVWFAGHDLSQIDAKDMRALRKKMQIIFQDPYSSLNPRMTVGNMLQEPMVAHGMSSSRDRETKVREILELVGLKSFHMRRYPHEFSGGQRQRISVARALTLDPEFIVCDEPVSALDVSIQSQVLNLLSRLKRELSLTYLFISHDLSVVRHIADRIGVMYLGRLVELASEHELFTNPLHPYTRALLSAVPVPDPERQKQRILLRGDLPSPSASFQGCPFSSRCPEVFDACHEHMPIWSEVSPGHFVSCHRVPANQKAIE